MKRGKFWIYCLTFSLLFLAPSLLYSESNETLEVPNLEPEAVYEMKGQDIMGMYQEINNLIELKNDYKSTTIESLELAKDAETLAQEYESENQKLVLQNSFLIGTTVCSVGIVVAGVITLVVMNIN